jgi:hypothetical protein
MAGCAAIVAVTVNVSDAPAANVKGGENAKVLLASGGVTASLLWWPALRFSDEKSPGLLNDKVTERIVSAPPVLFAAVKEAFTCWPGAPVRRPPGALKSVAAATTVGVELGVMVGVAVGATVVTVGVLDGVGVLVTIEVRVEVGVKAGV